MKRTFTYYAPAVTASEGKANTGLFDSAIEAFTAGDYRESLHMLLDSVGERLRHKYGDPEGDRFRIPHGPVYLHIRQENDTLYLSVPFAGLPEKNRMAMMRQVAGLNFSDLDLARFRMKEDGLYLEYDCPVALAHPGKVRYVLEEICRVGARYDREFRRQFGAPRLERPLFVPYSSETVAYAYEALQQSCRECLEGLRYFEPLRKFNDMWDLITATFFKIVYTLRPQGELLHTLEGAIRDMDRDIPLAAVVAGGKQALLELEEMAQEEVADSLYFTEAFIPGKQLSGFQHLREDCRKCCRQVAAFMEAGDYRTAYIRMVREIYGMLYYKRLQEEPCRILADALGRTSACSWSEAAPVLYEALEALAHHPLKADYRSPAAA